MARWRPDRPGGPSRLLDRFGIVLLLVVATVVVQALVNVRGAPFGGLVAHSISGLALVVAVRAADAPRSWRRFADVLVASTLVANLAYVLSVRLGDAETRELGGELLWMVAAAMVPVVVARRVWQHPEVTLPTVLGTVAAYLQIAVAYAAVFQLLDAVMPTPLFGGEVRTTAYTYVSLQTITTLGVGDLTPVTELGRLAMVSEAVLGQVFLVTFVALIVSRFAARRVTAPDDEA